MKKLNPSSKKRKEIVRLYKEEKISAEKIGEIIGCSEFPIRRFLREDNIPMRKSKTSVVSTDEINRLYKTGIDSVQIAKKFGLTPSAISVRIDRNIIRKRGPDPILSDLDLIKYQREGKSIAYLSKKFYNKPYNTALRDRAYTLGCFRPDDDWITSRKNPIKFHGGYAQVKIPDHPRADKKGYVKQHVVVMETILRRYLLYDNQDGELVHHIDGNKIHNAPSNLLLCKNNYEHIKIHSQLNATLSKLVKCGMMIFDITQRAYRLNFENPIPTKERKINPNTIKRSGYLALIQPDHHRADPRGRVLEHIIVAEKKYARKISRNEPIHHIDFDKLNNSPDNLHVCRDHTEHNALLKNQVMSLVRILIDNGILLFDKDTKEYYIWESN